jgi:hypothetical protein
MGGGSIPTTCDACDGGKVNDDGSKPDSKTVAKIATVAVAKMDKRSKQYKDAVQNMCKETGCDESTARRLIDEEMDKL